MTLASSHPISALTVFLFTNQDLQIVSKALPIKILIEVYMVVRTKLGSGEL